MFVMVSYIIMYYIWHCKSVKHWVPFFPIFGISDICFVSTRVTTYISGQAYFWCCQVKSEKSLTFFSIIVLRTFWCMIVICVIYSDMKKLFGKQVEWTREHFRSIIFYNFRRGLSQQECIVDLKSLFGDKAASYSTVKNWFTELWTTVSKRRDPWRFAKNSPCVRQHWFVHELIMQDRHVTYREIKASLGISTYI